METLPAWLSPTLLWFIVGFIFIALEFVFPSLVKVFFGLGAWVVALICLFIDISLNTQLFIFFITSLLFLGLLRRVFKKFLQGRTATHQMEVEDIDEFLGQKAIVKVAITPNAKGRIEFRGTDWDAEAYEEIPEGVPVEIIDKNNITLIVKSL
jgi:membrane protein implicated in regulation of membrane protease activity